MKWEPNIVGYPISDWPRQAGRAQASCHTIFNQRRFRRSGSLRNGIAEHIMDLSDNIMLAHYQRERS